MRLSRLRKFIASRLNNRDERGAYMVLWALLLVALITMAAIAIDLSSLRTDRRSDRLVADSAVTAAAAKLTDFSGGQRAACSEAWSYAAHNLGISGSTDPCPAVTWTGCTDTPPSTPQSAQGTMGNYTVTIETPVPDGDPLMTSADAIGGGIPQGLASGDQAHGNSDGTQCQRIGMTVTLTRSAFFGGIVGSKSGRTTVHSVARSATGTSKMPASVVLLDPTDCSVLTQNSSANSAFLTIKSLDTPPINGAVVVVSNATTGGNGAGKCRDFSTYNDYEVFAKNTSSPGGLNINPGDLFLGAYSGPTCGTSHACNDGELGSSIVINSIDGFINKPRPIPQGVAIDRTLVDYIFNCRTGAYGATAMPEEFNPPRTSTEETGPGSCGSASDWVNQYVGHVVNDNALFSGDSMTSVSGGACPASGSTVTGDFDFNCNFPNNFTLTVNGDAIFEQSVGSGATVTVTGNAKVIGNLSNPNNFTINGNAYFKNSLIKLSGSNVLQVKSTGAGYPASSCAPVTGFSYTTSCVKRSGSDFHTVFLSGSNIQQTGGTLTFDHTFAYAGDDPDSENPSNLSLGGGGNINWSPPAVGPFNEPNGFTDASGNPAFSQLSLWSDTVGSASDSVSLTASSVQSLGGGGTLNMGGVFYSPSVCWSLGGNSPTSSTKAQFIAYCLGQTGNGSFNLQPAINFVGIPVASGPVLIR